MTIDQVPASSDASNLTVGVQSTALKPLRIWPALLLVAGMLIARWIPSLIEDGPSMIWMSAAFGPALFGILILLWWLLASRATWKERIVGFLACVLAFGLTVALVDKSLHGPVLLILTIPLGTALFAIGASLFSRTLSFKRTWIACLLAVCGFGFSTLLQAAGMWGDFSIDLDWRWNATAEQQLLSSKLDQSNAAFDVLTNDLDQQLASPEWPGFRGLDRTSRQNGSVLATDWEANPPEQLWKVKVGPGWASFAVAGDLLFTQEQRGPAETVVCYRAETGQEVWTQAIESRFEEAIGGTGPRATPTIAKGQLFAMTAEGHVLRLEPKSGDIVWRQDLREVAKRSPPMWGFSSSPLVTGSSVIVHAGGSDDKGLLAFDFDSGELTWSVPSGGHTYCSPQLSSFADEPIVFVATDTGVTGVEPESGNLKLQYEWKHNGYRVSQPQMIDAESMLIPSGMGTGTRRIRLRSEGDMLAAEEVWTSRNMKPDFNDLVIFEGHAYGFDNTIFACVDLETGERKWKGGRYGKGQVLLLADCGLLLVSSEKGEVVLLRADSASRIELATFQAIEGKTWNHPVVVGDRLYIRNGQEAACYRLPLAN